MPQINQFPSEALTLSANDYIGVDRQISPGVYSTEKAKISALLSSLSLLPVGTYIAGGTAVVGNPSASSTYYVGGDYGTPLNQFYSRVYIPIYKSGTIKACFLRVCYNVGGSAESVVHYLRVNDTTDVSLGSMAYNGSTATLNKNDLSVKVDAGNTVALKLTTPAWVTPPQAVRYWMQLYME